MDEVQKLIITNVASFVVGGVLGWFKFFLDRKGKRMDFARESRIEIRKIRRVILDTSGRDQLLVVLEKSKKLLKSECANVEESLPKRSRSKFNTLLKRFSDITEGSLGLGLGNTPAELEASYNDMNPKVQSAKNQLLHCLDQVLKLLGD